MPAFLITIDTEGDNLWSRPREITTRNSRFLPRFQALCERYGFLPTYLTNYEMALCPDFRAFGLDALRRGTAEIGMHLHAWNSPPLDPLTANDSYHQPYLIQYPEPSIRSKVVVMTELLETTFGVKMSSHRAGRWSFNEVYARVLIECGYRADCSVTPRVSWADDPGDPRQTGGTDYTRFPESPYWLNLDNISVPGNSTLLEVPMTIVSLEPASVARIQHHLPRRSLPARALRYRYPPAQWLRPNGSNLSFMLRALDQAHRDRRLHVEFMLHSSEFMPGGSPTFPSEASIEKLYDDMEVLFARAADRFQPATLSGFASRFPRDTVAGTRTSTAPTNQFYWVK
jgi:hypothetical protein